MKTIYYKDFGICPHCGGRMMYMISTYQLGVPGPGGTSLSRVIGEDKDITAVCSKCAYKVPMESSLYGITTKEFAELEKDRYSINKDKKINFNVIGYIDSKEH